MVGTLGIGSAFPIRVQTMANTDTNDIQASVEQAKRCFEAGAEIVRFTTQGSHEAESLREIHKNLSPRLCRSTEPVEGEHFSTSLNSSPRLCRSTEPAEGEPCKALPLVADVHFNPNVADLAAQWVEKVRINPGNYIDPARVFKHIDYTDEEYAAELQRLRERFIRLLNICKEHHTALRIGVNHGSLSDRIMSRYGDTPAGMVESCMEFLRVAVDEQFSDIVLSIKASNTKIMTETVRLLVKEMDRENMHFPLHLGVTEAGEGEDGRIKSAVGIGSLLHDGIGDTIRVSLSEAPEAEIPVAEALRDYFAKPDSIRYHGVSVATEGDTVYYTSAQTDWSLFQLQAAAECGKYLLDSTKNSSPNVGEVAAGRRSIVLTNPNFPAERLDTLAKDILQAAGLIRYKTEYVSCPSCGRTLFNIEEVIREVRGATGHLKGLKIAVMGCIVNGPGEMADADYGYVGAGRGKISLYRSKECVLKNIPQEEAVAALVNLIKQDGKWDAPLIYN
ncbi:MAG: (E)-4-hydroxy-3-methylbut-2-enyl-diphosphate synthase [Paludibacteraceae bacterium]|nr:(E)-4-hydroxy-3-methylbut-2-enyl-diphosphate synthase [Paludibacteraceae bacterium]